MVKARTSRSAPGAGLGARILDARIALGWTQEECARTAEVSVKLVSNIECGRVQAVTRRIAGKLERALGVRLGRYIKV